MHIQRNKVFNIAFFPNKTAKTIIIVLVKNRHTLVLFKNEFFINK